MEIIQSEKQEGKKMMKNEQSQRPVDTIKHTNIHVTGVPEGDGREKEIEEYLKE